LGKGRFHLFSWSRPQEKWNGKTEEVLGSQGRGLSRLIESQKEKPVKAHLRLEAQLWGCAVAALHMLPRSYACRSGVRLPLAFFVSGYE
jgi:hypothetical protein